MIPVKGWRVTSPAGFIIPRLEYARFFQEENMTKYKEEFTHIDNLELPVRAINIFKHEGIRSMEEIDNMSDKQILMIPNFGLQTLKQVREDINIYKNTGAETHTILKSKLADHPDRNLFAGLAMKGILSNSYETTNDADSQITFRAVELAESLIRSLCSHEYGRKRGTGHTHEWVQTCVKCGHENIFDKDYT